MFATSSLLEEVKLNARKNAKEGRTPGKNVFVVVLISLAIFLISQVAMCFPLGIYMLFNVFSKYDVMKDFTIELSFDNGTFDSNMVLIMLYSEIVMILLFVLYVKRFEKRSPSTLGFIKKGAFSSYLLGVVSATVFLGTAVLICVVTGAVKLSYNGFDILQLILYIFAWGIQGLAEEVMCRGFLMTSIVRRNSVTCAVIINSLLFSLLHAFNPSGMAVIPMINLFLFGVFASMMFIRSGNIWLCAAFHSIWNLLQGSVMGIPVSGIKIPSILDSVFSERLWFVNGGNFGLEGGIAVSFVLVVGCLILFFAGRKKAN